MRKSSRGNPWHDKLGRFCHGPDAEVDTWGNPISDEQRQEGVKYSEKSKEEYAKRNQLTSKDVPVYPIRPKKSNYSSEEKYYLEKEKYCIQKEKYTKKCNEVIDSWKNQKSIFNTEKDIRTWASEKEVTISEETYKKTDYYALRDVCEVCDELFKKYPDVKENQDKYHQWEIKYEDTMSFYMNGNAGITLSSSFSDYEFAAKESIDLQKQKEKSQTTLGDGTIKTLIRHEFGHNAQFFIESNVFYTINLNNHTHKKEREKRQYEREKYEKELIEITKKHGSPYAKTNTYEAFAEGFSEYTSNPNSKYGKVFGAFFNKWYKKAVNQTM